MRWPPEGLARQRGQAGPVANECVRERVTFACNPAPGPLGIIALPTTGAMQVKSVHPGSAGHGQHALRDNEEQFRLLVQGVTDYAIYMLDTTGHVTNWNAGGERIKGYSADEIVGRHFSLFYTPEDRERGEPARALATARDAGKYETEGWRVRQDGTRFWASVVIDPVYDDVGTLIGFAKITRDVTERREAEQALDAVRQGMLQAQKIQAIGQLTYGVAHDFNNLLTIITNSLDLIALDCSDPQRVRRLVAGAHGAAERGALLTRQLLTFSRRQALRPEARDVNAMIYGMEAMLRRAVGETIEFELNLVPGISLCDVDASEFDAAMLNLVVNARDAMPHGGRLRIRTRERVIEDPAALGEARPGRFVCVSVEDTGEGMSQEVQARALEPFFTTKEVGKGSGLGLSQVYGFVAQTGGHVTIESTQGQGSTIGFYLPVSAQPQAWGAPETSEGPVKILLVEDDVDLQAVALESLRYMGYAALVANDGASALEILRRDTEVDILFTDVVMPRGMTGVELAEQALALRPELKVLLASGYSRSQLPAIPEGCEFIPKPYRIEDLEARLRQLLPAARA